MAFSVLDLYREILPKTNCGDCSFSTCLAFASMVVSEMLPIENCPYLDDDIISKCKKELQKQYSSGKWLKKDPEGDALEWARSRAASVGIEDLPGRIGGQLLNQGSGSTLELPYFTGKVLVSDDSIKSIEGTELTRWEKVFIYNHIAHGGRVLPTGNWKSFVEFPNTVSKIKSMKGQVERPLIERFKGNLRELEIASTVIGGIDSKRDTDSADARFLFQPLPRIPVSLVFWDHVPDEGLEAEVKLLFDQTITEHLDIESIIFLSERLRQLLCETVIH